MYTTIQQISLIRNWLNVFYELDDEVEEENPSSDIVLHEATEVELQIVQKYLGNIAAAFRLDNGIKSRQNQIIEGKDQADSTVEHLNFDHTDGLVVIFEDGTISMLSPDFSRVYCVHPKPTEVT